MGGHTGDEAVLSGLDLNVKGALDFCMKQRELINKIAKAAKRNGAEWVLIRNGANHDVYSLEGVMIPIPRHAEIGNRGAEMIWKECEEVLGKGWWR